LLTVDAFGLFFVTATIAVAIITLALGYSYLAHREGQPEEYYILIVIATAGAAIMALSTHFMSFYLGLEILSVSQYGLLAYVRRDSRGTEAGLKYLVLAAASAAFLLYGMALVYAELGTMEFAKLAAATPEQMHNKVVLLGVAMMFASIGFKLSVVPFHLWTADVYEGAPAPVVAFVATASKLGMFAVLVRYFAGGEAALPQSLALCIGVAAAASMIVGNLLALIQRSLKRLLAYSSIAHMGYVLVAFLATRETAGETVAFYMVAYSASTLAAFGVIMTLSTGYGRVHELDKIEDYRGLYRSHPIPALVLLVSLLSLAGIPLTAGFLGKFYIVLAGAQTGAWTLLVILALSSAVGSFYYLRAAVALFTAPAADAERAAAIRIAPVMQLLLAGLAIAQILMGTLPSSLLAIIHSLNAP
jgi:NADH-quinone oxidoreductase subunit N